jgi:hypothetical protein
MEIAFHQGYFCISKQLIMNNNTRTILKWIPSGIVSLMLLLSGTSKISGLSPMAAHFKEMQLEHFIGIFGAMEIIFAASFLYPKTMKVGLLLLTAYFGGAMAVELPYGVYVLAPMTILCLVWFSAFVRSKEIFFPKVDPKQSELSFS